MVEHSVCAFAEQEPLARSCLGQPEYEHDQKRYCVLHLPDDDKLEDFRAAVSQKLADKDFDFQGVVFPQNFALFENKKFDADANFSDATFGIHASFRGATFGSYASFDGATFKGSAMFQDLRTLPETVFSFRPTSIEHPERISFHTTHLRPNWFVDVDAQKFDFSDVEWFRKPDASKSNADELEQLELEDEVGALVNRLRRQRLGAEEETLRRQSLRKLTKACRRLMNNAEENRDYPTANEFHYWSMEAQRKEGWGRLGVIGTLYWALSGYGERPRRALGVLFAAWSPCSRRFTRWRVPKSSACLRRPAWGKAWSVPGRPWCTAWPPWRG